MIDKYGTSLKKLPDFSACVAHFLPLGLGQFTSPFCSHSAIAAVNKYLKMMFASCMQTMSDYSFLAKQC